MQICLASGQATWDMGYEEVTRVILMYVDTADCYKVPQSQARLWASKQDRINLSLSLIVQVPLLYTASPASSARPPTVHTSTTRVGVGETSVPNRPGRPKCRTAGPQGETF